MKIGLAEYIDNGFIFPIEDGYLVSKDAPSKVKKELAEFDDEYFDTLGIRIIFFDNPKKKMAQDGIIEKIKAFFK